MGDNNPDALLSKIEDAVKRLRAGDWDGLTDPYTLQDAQKSLQSAHRELQIALHRAGWPTHDVAKRAAVGWRGFRAIQWPDGKVVLEGRHEKAWLESRLQATCEGYSYLGENPVHKHLMSGACSCGIYAYNQVTRTSVPYQTALVVGSNEIIMQVLGWGAVAFHEYGWRAEHVKVVAGWVPPGVKLLKYASLTATVTPRQRYGRYGRMVPIHSEHMQLQLSDDPVTLDLMREMWPEVAWQEGLPEGVEDGSNR